MTLSVKISENKNYASVLEEIAQAGRDLFMWGYDKIVFTNGCFDLLHLGHLKTLDHCRAVAGPQGAVVVGINSDASVKKLKGDSRPVMLADERAQILMAMRFVDHVVVFDEETPLQLIEALRPDVIVKGGDYDPLSVVGRTVAPVSIAPFDQKYSSSDIIRRIRES